MRVDKRYSRLAGISTVLSLIVCYGTLGLISVLGALGFAIAVDNTLWAGAIVAFAVLAVIGLGFGVLRHKSRWPLMLGSFGTIIIIYVMYVQYDRAVEISGFALLAYAAFWDWQLKKT